MNTVEEYVMSTTTLAPVEPDQLPDRIVVGKNGAYWRDFGEFYSMCVVSTDNDPVEPVAVYVRVRTDPLVEVIDAARAVDVASQEDHTAAHNRLRVALAALAESPA